MNLVPRSIFRLRHKSWSLLVVGVLAGVTVGGGVGVIAASSTKTVTVCSNKKTDIMRYAKNGKCTKTEIKVVLNQTGSTGDTGATGAAGAKGDTGAAGTNGTAGAKGDTGATGAAGSTGAAGGSGAVGDTGTAGTNGTAGATGSGGASFTTGFTALSVCGSNGTTLCAVGEQGPGGGKIFYVDSAGKYGDFDYLESSPADASFVAWSTTTVKCGVAQNFNCQTAFVTTSGEALKFLAIGAGRAATAAIVARHDAGLVLKSAYAAGVADAYTTPTATDWWLPSRDELNELCKYARNTGQAAGAETVCTGGTLLGFTSDVYWSSSEYKAGAGNAWTQYFFVGNQFTNDKVTNFYVRPVRGF